MLKSVTIVMLTGVLAIPAFAQEGKPSAPQEGKVSPAAPTRPPEPPAQPSNIKIEVVITDQSAGREPRRNRPHSPATSRSRWSSPISPRGVSL